MKNYLSKHIRLTDRLKRDIEAGNFDGLKRLPGELRLAKLYGCARATVRKSLELLEESGTVTRDQAARWQVRRQPGDQRTTADQRTRILLLQHGMDALGIGLWNGICAAALEAGVDCFRCEMDITGHIPVPQELLATEKFAGMLFEPAEFPAVRNVYLNWERCGKPVVCLDRGFYNMQCVSVGSDNVAGAYQATAKLLSRYLEPVHFFCYPLHDATSNTERYNGYAMAMRDAGFGSLVKDYSFFFNFVDLDTHPDYNKFSGAWRHLRQLTPPINIFTSNDYAALAVYHACATLNWQIGREVRIIGFDDSPLAYKLRPRLTSMRQNSSAVGAEALKLLLRIINGEETTPRSIRLPVELVEKESH